MAQTASTVSSVRSDLVICPFDHYNAVITFC
ncbi:hypothetical protein CGLO_10744 [Colletotrichum gloeosporioides Cg-14]|uniref:Uncharacterized protein n=1 Tax=Colletotrichum gloeosporioides (strain Cg-14) TaxID=1237896 RepID=T0LNS6_COLGC|nr:hypothetical protein CGLO_10744 [Colletotrichum gloeosporioides Cg-14]